MLDELKKVHPNGVLRPLEGNNVSPPRIRVKNKSTIARKKPRNLVKVFFYLLSNNYILAYLYTF